MSSIIDGMFIFLAFILVSYVFDQENQISDYIRVGTILFLFFVYEPICTSKFCTIGQKIAGIRVRKIGSLEKISMPAAYIRIIAKLFLGIISFLAIVFSRERRAIHDFAAGSIVIEVA